MSDFGSDYITMTDEEGNEFIMEHLDTLEREGSTYMAFGVVDQDSEAEDDEVSVVIMKVVEQNGEELLEEVTDEALLEEIFGEFMERSEEDGEEGE